MTLTNEDAVRKAKAYILFYVERTDQVASDKTATNSSATERHAVDSVCSVVCQEEVSADAALTHIDFIDVAAPHKDTVDDPAPDNAVLENVGEDVAELHKADTALMEAAADSDTSDKAVPEEASQAGQKVAQ